MTFLSFKEAIFIDFTNLRSRNVLQCHAEIMLAVSTHQMDSNVNASLDSLVHCARITLMIVQQTSYVKMMELALMEMKLLAAVASQDMQEPGNHFYL